MPMKRFSDTLRTAMESYPEGPAALARASDLDAATLCRFRSGVGGLSVEGIDRLCKALGLELAPATPTKAKPAKAGGKKGK